MALRHIPLASPDNFAKQPAYWRVRFLLLHSPVLLADFLSYLWPVRTVRFAAKTILGRIVVDLESFLNDSNFL